MSKSYVDLDEEHKEAWSDDGIPCPYCGHVHTQDLCEIHGAHSEDGGEIECDECRKDFSFSTYISYSYTSYQRDRK